MTTTAPAAPSAVRLCSAASPSAAARARLRERVALLYGTPLPGAGPSAVSR